MKRAFITGISGFAGSHLAEFLLQKKYIVGGTFIETNTIKNVKGIRKDIELYKCDVRNFLRVSSLLKIYKPDEIYHLAGIASIPGSLRMPGFTYEVNFNGTFNLLDAARRYCENAKILYVGSAHEYGNVDRNALPVKESHPLNPETPYGASKAAGEMLAHQFLNSYQMKIYLVRPFNHIGPRQSPDFAVSNFARQIIEVLNCKGTPLINVGNLGVYRDITDVMDVVRAYWLIMQKGKSGEVYNVCSGRAVRLRDILNELISITKRKISVKVDKKLLRKTDMPKFYGDNKKLRAIGWAPDIKLKKTLSDILRWWMSSVKKS